MSKNNRGNSKPNDVVLEFAHASFKKWKKHNDYFDSKKEAKKAYMLFLIDELPDVIEWLLNNSHRKNDEKVQELKNEIYAQINDPDFVKVLEKEISNGARIEGVKLMPIIIADIIFIIADENKKLIAADKNASIYPIDHLESLLTTILKKKLKKFAEAGVPQDLAIDILTVIPCPKALEYGVGYRIRQFYEALYRKAGKAPVDFEKVQNLVIKEDYAPMFITFALLERKEKFAKFNKTQQELYVQISNWAFSTMNKLDRDTIEKIVRSYVNTRKKDEGMGKDGNRRYALNALPEDDYEKIAKTIRAMKAKDETLEKYLN